MLVGSNYIEWAPGSGVIASYDGGIATIAAQLSALRADGQAYLRLPLCFYDGAADGVNLDTSGGVILYAHVRQFRALLAQVYAAGFSEVEIALCPQAGNSPFNWGDAPKLETNWNMLVRSIIPALADSGLKYWIDLNNEGIPAPGQDQFLRYVREMYEKWWYVFGVSNTIGFSIQPDGGRLARINEVYQGTFPLRMSAHIYGGFQEDSNNPLSPVVYGSAYEVFLAIDAALRKIGFVGELGVGEMPYCDPTTQEQLRLASVTTGRVIPSMAQWPVDLRLPMPKDASTNVIPRSGGFERLLNQLRNPRS